MTEADFAFLRDYLKKRSGLALGPEKRYLVESRLSPVCRRFNLATLSDLVGTLRLSREGPLERAVVEAMTTNETFFFRDRVPSTCSATCSCPRDRGARGDPAPADLVGGGLHRQEPYSLAMLVHEAAAQLAGWQIEIVGTDLSTEVLEKAGSASTAISRCSAGCPSNCW